MGIPKGGIAFFDSGIGGLTVLAACRQALPQEQFYYYGDNQHAPYGNLPVKKIRRYVFRAFKKLKRYKVRAVVIACNTVTALCIEELRRKYNFPIIGIEPAILPAASRGGEVFVLSTRATYESRRFHELCDRAMRQYPTTKIFSFACDGLAGVIEKRILFKEMDYTKYLPRGKPTAVVLGCTHYGYIKEEIRRFYGCDVIDGNDGVAMRLLWCLQREKEKNTPIVHRRPPRRLFCARKSYLTTCNLTNGEEALKDKRYFGKNEVEKGRNNTSFVFRRKGEIFFLGRSKVVNKTIFEQMFVS